MLRCAARLSSLLLLAILTVGCGGEKLYAVRGKVVYPDGTPLPGGWVMFEEVVETERKRSPDGPVNADGTFEMRTIQPGDGVPAGKYRVLVKAKEIPLNELQKSPPMIDPKFTRFETSEIEFVVEPKANFFEIKITKP